MICRDHTDLDMQVMHTLIARFQHGLSYAIEKGLKNFTGDPNDEHAHRTLYARALTDITRAYYLGELIRRMEQQDATGIFAIMIVSDSVGFSPEAH